MFGTGIGVYLPHLLYLAVILGACASIARPTLGLYLIALILPLYDGRAKMDQFPFGDRTIELLLLTVAIGLLVRGEGFFPNVKFRFLILAIAVTGYLSLWIAPVLLSSVPWPLSLGESPFALWILYVRMLLLFLVTASGITSKREIHIILLCMLVSFLWVNKGFYGTTSHRDMSTYSHALRGGAALGYAGANGLAAFQAQCVLFVVGLFSIRGNLKLKAAMAAAAAVGTYGVVFSFSRGAYIALAAGLLYLAVFRMRILIPVLLVAGLSWQYILPGAVQQRITMSYSEEEGLDDSNQGRLDVWSHALQTTLRDPVLGVGFACYRYYRANEELKDTHNMYLRALVETGVVGLLLLLTLWIKAYFAAHRLFRSASDPFLAALGSGFAAYMAAVFIGNFFGDRWTYIEISGYTFILLALVVRGQMITDEAKKTAANPSVGSPKPALAPPVRTPFVVSRGRAQ